MQTAVPHFGFQIQSLLFQNVYYRVITITISFLSSLPAKQLAVKMAASKLCRVRWKIQLVTHSLKIVH